MLNSSKFKSLLRMLISLKKKSGDFSKGGIHINPTTSKPRDLQYECKSDTDDLFTPNFCSSFPILT